MLIVVTYIKIFGDAALLNSLHNATSPFIFDKMYCIPRLLIWFEIIF